MKTKKSIKILRTEFPYLTDDEKIFLNNYQKELKKNNIGVDEGIREIFNSLGVDIDLDSMIEKCQ